MSGRSAVPADRADKVRGCLFGGAVGDALGYPVEFMGEGHIFAQYGEYGIRAYDPDPVSGRALISDDTQMTLFTANGLLRGMTESRLEGGGWDPEACCALAYQDWLRTQEMSWKRYRAQADRPGRASWLCDVPELYSRRAPGTTCMSALLARRAGTFAGNDSKGCGGVMRVSPAGLLFPAEQAGRWGAAAARLTHGHSLGWLPAAMLAHMVSQAVFSNAASLGETVLAARDAAAEQWRDDPHIGEMTDLISLAVRLSGNGEPDLANIHLLGEGWTGDEALAIAVYCALRYQDDFSAGVAAAVNHRGDSDSTGAVTGNILGAWLGYGAIAEKWKRDLELSDVILEMADDLAWAETSLELADKRNHQRELSPRESASARLWIEKYAECRRPEA